jgi:hypothetical protein
MEFLYGLAGFLLGVGSFFLGFYVGKTTARPVKRAPEKDVTEAEIKRAKREREELEADQRAFRALVGYSADVAYGLTEFQLESDKS